MVDSPDPGSICGTPQAQENNSEEGGDIASDERVELWVTMMQHFWERIDRLEQRIRPYLPFTALNTVWRLLDKKGHSLLDVGCGPGKPAKFLRSRMGISMVGVDAFWPSLREAQRQESHDAYVLGDVRHLPFRPKSFDVVLAVEVLEHLEKEEGLALIRAMEQIARRQVLLTTPVGSHKQDPYNGNRYQEHKHVWQPRELEQLGHRVRGHGVRNIGGMSGVQSPLPRLLRPLMNILWVLASPVTYFLPSLGGGMVAMKRIGGSYPIDSRRER